MSDKNCAFPKNNGKIGCSLSITKDKLTIEENELNISIFKTSRHQIMFEFIYLLITFVLACVSLFIVHLGFFRLSNETRWYLYSFIGGFLGGWTFDAKWFYRVTGRGKNNQYPWKWEPHKLYWRVFIPLLASITSFGVYTLSISGIFPVVSINQKSGAAAFGFSYVAGCFSDIVFTKLANWVEGVWGKDTAIREKNSPSKAHSMKHS
jgi:hypothetical protein